MHCVRQKLALFIRCKKHKLKQTKILTKVGCITKDDVTVILAVQNRVRKKNKTNKINVFEWF